MTSAICELAFHLDLLVLPIIMVSTLGFDPASGAVAIAITLLIEAAMLVDGRGWIALTAGPDAPAAYQVMMLVLELAGLYAGALSARFQDVNAALSESQERYRTLVDDSPTGIVVAQDGRFCYANQTAATIMAAPGPDALIGCPVVPEQDGLPYGPLLGNPMDDAIPGTPFELHIRRLDGQEIQVEVVASPVTYDGLPAQQIVFADITERRMAEEALRLSEERFFSDIRGQPPHGSPHRHARSHNPGHQQERLQDGRAGTSRADRPVTHRDRNLGRPGRTDRASSRAARKGPLCRQARDLAAQRR